ncbi:MAG TPA: site-2 protease family protein [Myxococcota bacterium]|nr:site-2 protease family protein [Myxococcota bacterium]HRY92973.1 site-2 protease family protein [Myxococcota bacterium]HSA19918.1 site-2 protease family protein [Myxococcota bacterium]
MEPRPDDPPSEAPPPAGPTPAFPPAPAPQHPPSRWAVLKKLLGPVVVVGLLLLKFGAKLKFLILPVIKFFPLLLKTGGTMALSLWLYAAHWGVAFAAGFVGLLLVHECGHLLAARRVGLKVGAPVFIPFMGAFIALKEAPRNAWIEAQVGLGGPLLGSLGAALCYAVYLGSGEPFWAALAYTGCLLNLFNLIPIGFLDGGRVATALSPWLWVVGLAVGLALAIYHPNLILFLVILAALPRVFWLFRKKSDQERRYFELRPGQRGLMAAAYFGLVLLLALGMQAAHQPLPGG